MWLLTGCMATLLWSIFAIPVAGRHCRLPIGKPQGKQTYRCGQCLYHFTEGAARPHLATAVKDRVVALYTEGVSLAAISRVEGLKGATVYALVQKKPGRLDP